jgi:hypothetical protein
MIFRSRHLLAALVALCGCSDTVVEPGMIVLTTSRVEAPDRVAVSTDFQVVVYTFGGGCHYFESTDVTPGDPEALIEPYDSRVEGGCTHELDQFPHPATLRFDSTGTKTIRIRGWDGNRQPTELTVPVTVE